MKSFFKRTVHAVFNSLLYISRSWYASISWKYIILRTEPTQDSSACHSRRFLQQTCCAVGTESADLVPMNLWQYITHLESTFKHRQGSPILTTASTVFFVVLFLHLFYKLYNLDMLNAELSLQWEYAVNVQEFYCGSQH